jgi:hypothetical protein
VKDTTIFKRADTWQLRRRVPARYAPVEERKVIWLSLHTDSESVARRKAAAAWVQLEEAWEARLAGDTNDAEKRYAAALNLCGMRGFRYLPAEKIAALPEEERIRRVEAVASGKPERFEAAALLGGIANPPLTVTRALDLYWTLARDRTLGKSEDQLRRWRNPRMKAVKNFAHVIGAKPLAEITADDALNFREWWIEKIEAEDLSPSSANKDFTHLADMVRTLNRMKRLGLPDLFFGVALKEGAKRTRPPFSTEWIRMRLIAPGALDGLNTYAGHGQHRLPAKRGGRIAAGPYQARRPDPLHLDRTCRAATQERDEQAYHPARGRVARSVPGVQTRLSTLSKFQCDAERNGELISPGERFARNGRSQPLLPSPFFRGSFNRHARGRAHPARPVRARL